jgi:ribose 1,5-bisphosphokinase
MSGRVIAVVGPSGVGKDSLIEALCADRPGIVRARRVITRDARAGGEAFDGISAACFADRAARGAFALHWSAHGLRYGIPRGVLDDLAQGCDVLANLSRGVLPDAARLFPALHVLDVTARPEVLARRLQARGRESRQEIARRLARPAPPLPDAVVVTGIDNSGALTDAVRAARDALYPVNL